MSSVIRNSIAVLCRLSTFKITARCSKRGDLVTDVKIATNILHWLTLSKASEITNTTTFLITMKYSRPGICNYQLAIPDVQETPIYVFKDQNIVFNYAYTHSDLPDLHPCGSFNLHP
jgi:hypothetical protein